MNYGQADVLISGVTYDSYGTTGVYYGYNGATGISGTTGFILGTFLGTDADGAEYGDIYNMNSYQNNPETVTLYWTFYPYGPIIHDMTWEVQADSVDTFDSDGLVSYYSHTGGVATDNFVSGIVHKGMAIPILSRDQSVDKSMYWRVCGTYGDAVSSWQSSVFIIPAAIDEAARNYTLSILPDVLYNKEAGSTPGEGSNIYKLHNAFAQELELNNQYLTMTANDAYTGSVRDVSIESNFGALLDIAKLYEMNMLDYREIIKSYMYNVRNAPNHRAISELVKSVYVNYPEYISIKDVFDMYSGSTGSTGDADYVEPFYTGDEANGVPDVTLWDNRHIAYGVIVEVINRMTDNDNVIVPQNYILDIVRKMAPSHVPVFLRYK